MPLRRRARQRMMQEQCIAGGVCKGMRFAQRFAVVLVVAFGSSSALVPPAAAAQGGPFDSVSIYAGQGVDHNLRELPGSIATGDVSWERSYFWAAGLGKTSGTVGQSFDSLRDSSLGSLRHGYELLLVQHRGLQSNAEIAGAFTLRTPDLQMGIVGVNFMAGAGLSYALGTPTYEDGTTDDPERRYRLQLLALIELEWRVRGLDRFSLSTRVHHRSGVYGALAPPHVGSNFLAIGVRYYF